MPRQIEEIVLKISVDDSNAKGKIGGIGDATEKAGKKVKKTEKGFNNLKDSILNAGTLPNNIFESESLKKFRKEQDKTKQSTKGLKTGLINLKTAIVALGLTRLAGEALDIAKQFDKISQSLRTVTSSQQQANSEFKFLDELADDLGVSLLTVAEGYTRLLGATKGTPLAGQVTKDLAEGVFELSTAMGLAESETTGIIRAVSQIATKGKLSSEELQQLAERGVPAFQLASKAIGVTTQELNKMLEQGKILSQDFLPKFSKQLRKEFAGAADEASNSIQANSNRLKNEWAKAIEGSGKALAKFIPLLTATIGLVNDFADAAVEAADGLNIWLDQIIGLEDQFSKPFTDAELAQIKAAAAARKLARDQKLATKEAKALALEEGKVAAALAKLDSLTNIEAGFVFDDLTERLANNLNLTEDEFEKLGPAIKKALEEGASFDQISEDVTRILDTWKDQFNQIEISEEKIINPFNELLKNATMLRDALDFSSNLGLTVKEFEKISGAIIKAREQGLTEEEIKAQVAGLRDVGFFDDDAKGDDAAKRFADASPVKTAFQVGTAEGSAFLQSKTEVEILTTNKKIEKNTRRAPVELIAK